MKLTFFKTITALVFILCEKVIKRFACRIAKRCVVRASKLYALKILFEFFHVSRGT